MIIMERLVKFNIAYVYTKLDNSGYHIDKDQYKAKNIESCVKMVLKNAKKDQCIVSILLVNQTNGITTFNIPDKYRF